MDADFYVFTGHKLYAPTGSGVLIVKPAILADMPPYQGGGDMIEQVSFDGTTYKTGPARFEAGTPDFMAVCGLGAAIDYLSAIGMGTIAGREAELVAYMTEQLQTLPDVTIYGAGPRVGIFSLAIDGCHPADLAMILDQQNIAVRVGHHCAQPLMAAMGVEGTLRASFGIYTDHSDIDRLIGALRRAVTMLRGAVTA
jgi:cysteine desulfurase/selenocysteine lyase